MGQVAFYNKTLWVLGISLSLSLAHSLSAFLPFLTGFILYMRNVKYCIKLVAHFNEGAGSAIPKTVQLRSSVRLTGPIPGDRSKYYSTVWRKGAGKRGLERIWKAPTSAGVRGRGSHIPSTAFRHLPPNSARTGYATEGAFFISAQLSTNAVSALTKVCVLIRLWKKHSAQAPT